MKTKVEIEGYEIEIEFEGGVISVKAEYDDEVVEEFTIEVEEGAQGQSQFEDEDEIQGFDEFGQDEEEDFEGEEDFEEEEFEGEEGFEEDEEAPALESFQSFINKRRRK
jgi:hypothetical protein